MKEQENFRGSWVDQLAMAEERMRQIAVERPVDASPAEVSADKGKDGQEKEAVIQTIEVTTKEPNMVTQGVTPVTVVTVSSDSPVVVMAEEMAMDDWVRLLTVSEEGEVASGDFQEIMAELQRKRLQLEPELSRGNALLDSIVQGRANALKEVRALYPKLAEVSHVRDGFLNQLRTAERNKTPEVVLGTLRGRLAKAEEPCILAGKAIARREQQYPDILAQVKDEMALANKALPLIAMFRISDGRYVDAKTPQPSHASAGGFLAEAVERAAKLGSLVQPSEGTAPVFSYRGRSWVAANPEIPQLVELCQNLASYASAILEAAHAEREKYLAWLTDRGYLMSRVEMERQQKATDAEGRKLCHRTFLDLVEKGTEGHCYFMELVPDRTAGRHEYGTGPYVKLVNVYACEGGAKYGVEVVSATTPESAEEVFRGTTDKQWRRPRMYFGKPTEVQFLSSVKNTPLGPALASAVRYAENRRKEDAARDRILAPTNTWITIHDMAEGKVGTCPLNYKVERGWVIGLLVSDGTTVTVGEFTPRSSRCSLVSEIGKSRSVGELFAKNGSGEFVIAPVAEAITRNEQYTIRWRLDVLAAKYGAMRVSAENVGGFALIGEESGDGVYVSTLHVGEQDRRPEQNYGYVVRRDGEKIAFVAAATPVSARKLTVKLGELCTFADLPNYELFYVRRVYQAVTKVTNEQMPDHLRARNQRSVKAKGIETPDAHDYPAPARADDDGVSL